MVMDETHVINQCKEDICFVSTQFWRDMQIAKYVYDLIYTYTVSRVMYTDKYCACIWKSIDEFRYERYTSVYITLSLLTV